MCRTRLPGAARPCAEASSTPGRSSGWIRSSGLQADAQLGPDGSCVEHRPGLPPDGPTRRSRMVVSASTSRMACLRLSSVGRGGPGPHWVTVGSSQPRSSTTCRSGGTEPPEGAQVSAPAPGRRRPPGARPPPVPRVQQMGERSSPISDCSSQPSTSSKRRSANPRRPCRRGRRGEQGGRRTASTTPHRHLGIAAPEVRTAHSGSYRRFSAAPGTTPAPRSSHPGPEQMRAGADREDQMGMSRQQRARSGRGRGRDRPTPPGRRGRASPP